jgi:NhaA family Na+:H+ antiporter
MPSNVPPPTPVRRILEPVERFLHIEASSGIVLILAAVVALLWANLPFMPSYDAFWHTPVTLGFGPWLSTRTIHFWVNEGLMTVFFLVVGLEIRRELHDGALASWRRASLPLVAAAGGVVVPALVYLSVTIGVPELRQGWAVPTATDIAFAIGVLSLLGRRVPQELRALLLALAVIDDIAAIIIIALFYSHGMATTGLIIAIGAAVLVVIFQRLGIRSAWYYVVPAFFMWAGLLAAGVHPAIAGVALGLMTPVRFAAQRDHAHRRVASALDRFRSPHEARGKSTHELAGPLRELKDAQIDLLPPVLRVQDALHPWVAFAVMPLFALANAGVEFEGLQLNGTFTTVFAGVVGGLLLGKPLGIAVATFLATRAGWCELPAGVNRGGIVALGCLAGIGFTMAIFIGDLAFASAELLAAVKASVLAASLMAAIAGYIVGRRVLDTKQSFT